MKFYAFIFFVMGGIISGELFAVSPNIDFTVRVQSSPVLIGNGSLTALSTLHNQKVYQQSKTLFLDVNVFQAVFSFPPQNMDMLSFIIQLPGIPPITCQPQFSTVATGTIFKLTIDETQACDAQIQD